MELNFWQAIAMVISYETEVKSTVQMKLACIK